MPFAGIARSISPITYADPAAPLWERASSTCIELLSGRTKLVRLYQSWRERWAVTGLPLWSSALYWLGTPLIVEGAAWPPRVAPNERLVVIANHPFGLMDGIAICALAERLRRPFKVLAHSALMTVPESTGYFLPIDFSETEEATRNNIAVRRQALAALKRRRDDRDLSRRRRLDCIGQDVDEADRRGGRSAVEEFRLSPDPLRQRNRAAALFRRAEWRHVPYCQQGQHGVAPRACCSVNSTSAAGGPSLFRWASRSNGRRSPPFLPPPKPCGSCGAGSMRCGKIPENTIRCADLHCYGKRHGAEHG